LSSIQLLLTRTTGPSYYFVNPSLLKQELFSAIKKSIRQWPNRLRDNFHNSAYLMYDCTGLRSGKMPPAKRLCGPLIG